MACKLTNNLGDINKVEVLPYADFWTCSFPCTDISVAGKMKGLKPDSGTRSSLLWENVRLLKRAKDSGTLPKYIMIENVKNLVSKKFIGSFNDLIDILDDLNFNTYWSVINGKDCGIPQNRERVFVIAIRKDIDTKRFTFPVPFDTGIRLKDVLEETVDEKYYLSDTATRKFKFFFENKRADIKVAGSLNPTKNVQDRVRVLDSQGLSQGLRVTDYKNPVKIVEGIDKSINDTQVIEYANCITTREDRGVSNRKTEETAVLVQVGQIYGTETESNPQAGRVYDSECLSPTLDTCSGGNRMPKIIQVGNLNSSQDGIVVSPDGISKTHTAGHNNMPKIIQLGQVSNDGSQAGKVYSPEGISQTICACTHGYAVGNIWDYIRIRKLTPRECWKLMGLTFKDCDLAAAVGVVDTHLYKQAGNGIITNCCELLAEHLYKAQYDENYVCFDENFTNPQAE